MDRNIAALLREDTYTVVVNFKISHWEQKLAQGRNMDIDRRGYTYVTHLPLEVGDEVIVHASGVLKVAEVVQVDDSVDIKPNADFQYSWVLAKVDLTEARANDDRNKQIEAMVQQAYQVNLRRSFAQQILAGVDPSQQDSLTKLLK